MCASLRTTPAVRRGERLPARHCALRRHRRSPGDRWGRRSPFERESQPGRRERDPAAREHAGSRGDRRGRGQGLRRLRLRSARRGRSGAHIAGVAAVAGHCYPVWIGSPVARESRPASASACTPSRFSRRCRWRWPSLRPVFHGVQQRALVSAGAASAAWLAASMLWWKRGLSNSWGPRADRRAASRDRGDRARGGHGVRPSPASPRSGRSQLVRLDLAPQLVSAQIA